MQIQFEVFGTPAPKGSSRAIVRGAYAVVVPGSSDIGKAKMQNWSAAVREAARSSVGQIPAPVFIQIPVIVSLEFRLRRPAMHWRQDKTLTPKGAAAQPITKPDVDKLARSTVDALTGIVFDDDSRVIGLYAFKRYASCPADEGAMITVKDVGA